MRDTESMIELNRRQAAFYDSISAEEDITGHGGYASHSAANFLTKIWAALRYEQQRAVSESKVEAKKKRFLEDWIEAKRGGDFLEIGCFRGTSWSLALIEASRHYVGIDLSNSAIATFSSRLSRAGFREKSTLIAGDFLLFDDTIRKYDLVFAHGVLHHFENPDPLFSKIERLLNDGGILLFAEPSAINVWLRGIRTLYRPFQSDRSWEWPFTKNTRNALERHFRPIDGFGWGRFSLPLSFLTNIPLFGRLTRKIYLRLLDYEMKTQWDDNVWANSTVTAAYSKRSDRKQ